MSRHLRGYASHPAPEPVSSYPVAPDHYNNPDLPEIDNTPTSLGGLPYREWKAKQPYQPGDVVWLERRNNKGDTVAVKAVISQVHCDFDRFGDRRAKYKVHLANAKGDRFSLVFTYTWPGFIMRGYQLAQKEQAP